MGQIFSTSKLKKEQNYFISYIENEVIVFSFDRYYNVKVEEYIQYYMKNPYVPFETSI